MEHKSTFSYGLLAALFATTSVHAQFGHTIGPLTDGYGPQHECVIGDDGSRYIIHAESPALILDKFSAQGEQLWSRAIQGDALPLNLWAFVSDGSDGLYGLVVSDIQVAMDINSPEPDTTRTTFVHFRLDGEGQLVGSNSHIVTETSDYFNAVSPHKVGLVRLEDGSLTGSIITGEGFHDDEYYHVIGLTADGLPGIHRRYVPVGDMMVDPIEQLRLFDAPDGGSYMVAGLPLSGLGRFFAARLGSDGTLLWANLYRYTNSSYHSKYTDFAVDTFGRIHAVGRLSLSTGNFTVFPVINVDGSMARSDMYRHTVSSERQQLFLTPQGERIAYMTGYNPLLPESARNALLVADTSDSEGILYKRVVHQQEPHDIFGVWQDADMAEGHLTLTGNLMHRHSDLAFLQRHRAILDLDINTIDPCLFTDTVAPRIEVPLSIWEVTPLTGFSGIDTDTAWTHTPGSGITVTPLDLLELGPLCITTSIDATGPTPMAPRFVAAPGTLRLASGDLDALDIFDAQGRAVGSFASLREGATIGITGWPGGVYLLRSITGSHEVAVQRIVIE